MIWLSFTKIFNNSYFKELYCIKADHCLQLRGWDNGSQEFQQKDKVLLPQALKVVGENCEPQAATTRSSIFLQRHWRQSAIEALTQ